MAEGGIKEKATSFLKTFGAELAIEFYHDDIASAVKELLLQYNPASLTQLIKESKPLNIPSSFFELMSEYQAVIKGYDVEGLAKLLYNLISEVRPDLGEVMTQLGDGSAIWLYRCTTMIRDRIVSPEKFVEEIEKSQTVKIVCKECNKSFRIFRDDTEEINQCPFCGAKGEEPEPAEKEPG